MEGRRRRGAGREDYHIMLMEAGLQKLQYKMNHSKLENG